MIGTLTITDYYNIVLSVVSGGSAGLISSAFLGKKILEHRLKKDIEIFKSELANKSAIVQKKNVAIYEKRFQAFNETWQLMTNVVGIHGNFKPDSKKDIKLLENSIDSLEDCISNNRPYISECIFEKIIALISAVSPESFYMFSQNDIENMKNQIAVMYIEDINNDGEKL